MVHVEDAAVYQIRLLEDLHEFGKFFPNLAGAVSNRLQHHLWYCSEEITPLSLASSLVSTEEKAMIAAAILEEAKTPNLKKGAISMPPLHPGATLISRIGPQSLHFFSALAIGTNWLAEPVTDWESIPAYQKFSTFAHNLPLSNAATERTVKRTTDFANYGARNEEDFQVVLQTVGTAIARVPSRRSKKALVEVYANKD